MLSTRDVRDRLKSATLFIHKIGLRCGFVIVPNHYYCSIPDIIQLQHDKAHWAHPVSFDNIKRDINSQGKFLLALAENARGEYESGELYNAAAALECGPGYGVIEAQSIYLFLRYFKPSKIIEVGCGLSTYCMLAASEKNKTESSVNYNHICVEPYPKEWLRSAPIKLIENKVQNLNASFFDELNPGDLLFIDSSHQVRTGGDVSFLFLEIIPKLKAGVFIHVHDIYFPYLYPRDTLSTFIHPMESALLYALLNGNSKMEIMLSLSMLHYSRPDILKEAFPLYDPEPATDGLRVRPAFEAGSKHFPSSIFIETK